MHAHTCSLTLNVTHKSCVLVVIWPLICRPQTAGSSPSEKFGRSLSKGGHKETKQRVSEARWPLAASAVNKTCSCLITTYPTEMTETYVKYSGPWEPGILDWLPPIFSVLFFENSQVWRKFKSQKMTSVTSNPSPLELQNAVLYVFSAEAKSLQ
jgi:hypothetical protein